MPQTSDKSPSRSQQDNKSNKNLSHTIWGGRFSLSPDQIMQKINASINFDRTLFAQDIAGSKAHAAMLAKQNIITQNEANQIDHGLNIILQEIETGCFQFSEVLEDIHMNIENRLSELIGPTAGRLHTARSRNDQVATDFKLWIRDTIDDINCALHSLQHKLADKALKHADLIMPGFTHLQSAQPVTFGHHLLAYVEMLQRDRLRFTDARKRLNECPLGSAALAGTSFPIDRLETAKILGFDRPTANSLDAVSDRDFVLETLSNAAISAMHLSRLAEELVLWSSSQFNFIRLSDKFTTGSSIMPQKRNPDAAELIRAKIGRIAASFQSLLMVMKALPLAYSKDMQEDKEQTFDALQAFLLMLRAMEGMIIDLSINEQAMLRAACDNFSTATDLADWLVQVLNLPFRHAHHITGRIVALAETKNYALHELPLSELQKIEPQITAEIFEILNVEKSVHSRTSYGGTAPVNVRKQAQSWLEKLT